MIKLKHIALLVFCTAYVTSCTKPFNAESFVFEKVIVVDGQVTDQNQFHYVNLSYTYPIGAQDSAPLGNATVWVEKGDGTIIAFEEIMIGNYQSASSFAGVTGDTYQLFFTTPEGRNYSSNSIELIKSPPIDSVYDKYAQLTSDESTSGLSGIQFFIDTHDETKKAKYFRYEWEEDYQIISPYPSLYGYDLELDSIYLRTERIHICYESGKSSNLIIGTTVGSIENRLIEFPVNFVSGLSDKLRNRYAINVKQYAINESAYGFYRKLKESNESGGSLFDKQQGTITGNILSIEDPNETILGFFEVAGASELRTFFNQSEFDEQLKRAGFRFQCLDSYNIIPPRDSIYYWHEKGFNIIITYTNSEGEPEFQMGPKTCTECAYYATNVKPEFWID
ncbi:MAG: hypothetical protein ACI8TA_001841 [Cyclobacteriaceae bacterium]|jgi:hypothetical protein